MDYSPQEVIERIKEFTDKYPEASYSYAHIVLDDFNLEDESILHCEQSPLYDEWLQQSIKDISIHDAKEYVKQVKYLLNLREHIVMFLVWLGGVNREIRDAAMELVR